MASDLERLAARLRVLATKTQRAQSSLPAIARDLRQAAAAIATPGRAASGVVQSAPPHIVSNLELAAHAAQTTAAVPLANATRLLRTFANSLASGTSAPRAPLLRIPVAPVSIPDNASTASIDTDRVRPESIDIPDVEAPAAVANRPVTPEVPDEPSVAQPAPVQAGPPASPVTPEDPRPEIRPTSEPVPEPVPEAAAADPSVPIGQPATTTPPAAELVSAGAPTDDAPLRPAPIPVDSTPAAVSTGDGSGVAESENPPAPATAPSDGAPSNVAQSGENQAEVPETGFEPHPVAEALPDEIGPIREQQDIDLAADTHIER
jgi:hypothetical protein